MTIPDFEPWYVKDEEGKETVNEAAGWRNLARFVAAIDGSVEEYKRAMDNHKIG